MTTPGERMRAIVNYKPPNKIKIPVSELKKGDLIAGAEVVKIWQDAFFVHYWTKGREAYPEGLYPDYIVEVERKQE